MLLLQIIGSKQVVLMWTELIWLTAEVSTRHKTSGGVMWTQQRAIRYNGSRPLVKNLPFNLGFTAE